MKLVATLVSDPQTPAVDNFVVGKAATALGVAASCTTLREGVAVDMFFEGNLPDVKGYERNIRMALDGFPVDIAVQQAENRKKKLFLADMDSTMIGQECIDELADHAGVKQYVAAITERAMRGEIAFEPALRERVSLLKGVPLTAIREIIDTRIVLTPGGPELVRTMRKNGAFTSLVSGGFTLFTGPLSRLIGFDEHHSNTLGVDGDHLNGEVVGPILGKDAKLATLKALRVRFNLEPSETMVAGDGANDLPMILEAGTGVAFHAKPKVAAAAPVNVLHADLTALLYFQGYRFSEFVT
ncbi:MAG: phosphoserine phosphatase SerB [Methylobacteriaceae bacterium]|jgi:phosphoserine phosphatase|nr:phosphoserine phosphatase SerB [Methylobacteriaceae bacterium]